MTIPCLIFGRFLGPGRLLRIRADDSSTSWMIPKRRIRGIWKFQKRGNTLDIKSYIDMLMVHSPALGDHEQLLIIFMSLYKISQGARIKSQIQARQKTRLKTKPSRRSISTRDERSRVYPPSSPELLPLLFQVEFRTL